MASALDLSLEFTVRGSITGTAGLSTPSSPIQSGTGSFDAMSLSLSYGVGTGKAKQLYLAERTLGAGLNDDLDLAGVLLNPLGEAITFTNIKLLIVAIDAPDGTKVVRVGPQGVANAWQGPFGGVVAASYKEVHNWEVIANHQWAGYPVGAGATDVLRINNPGGAAVTYRILIAGETA